MEGKNLKNHEFHYVVHEILTVFLQFFIVCFQPDFAPIALRKVYVYW